MNLINIKNDKVKALFIKIGLFLVLVVVLVTTILIIINYKYKTKNEIIETSKIQTSCIDNKSETMNTSNNSTNIPDHTETKHMPHTLDLMPKTNTKNNTFNLKFTFKPRESTKNTSLRDLSLPAPNAQDVLSVLKSENKIPFVENRVTNIFTSHNPKDSNVIPGIVIKTIDETNQSLTKEANANSSPKETFNHTKNEIDSESFKQVINRTLNNQSILNDQNKKVKFNFKTESLSKTESIKNTENLHSNSFNNYNDNSKEIENKIKSDENLLSLISEQPESLHNTKTINDTPESNTNSKENKQTNELDFMSNINININNINDYNKEKTIEDIKHEKIKESNDNNENSNKKKKKRKKKKKKNDDNDKDNDNKKEEEKKGPNDHTKNTNKKPIKESKNKTGNKYGNYIYTNKKRIKNIRVSNKIVAYGINNSKVPKIEQSTKSLKKDERDVSPKILEVEE